MKYFLFPVLAIAVLIPITTFAAQPSVSIKSASEGIRPAVSMAVAYDGVPKSTLQILNGSGKVVGSRKIAAGGGSAVVTFSKALPSGRYTAQIVGSHKAVLAKSEPTSFFYNASRVKFSVTPKNKQTIVLGLYQTASDGGVDIKLESVAKDSSRKPVVNLTIHPKGYDSGFYSVRAGKELGFADSAIATGAIDIRVKSIDLEAGTATLVITTETKG